MSKEVSYQDAVKITAIGDKVTFFEDGSLMLTHANGKDQRRVDPVEDGFWVKLANLALENEASAKILRGRLNQKVVRDPIFSNGYLVECKGHGCREGRVDMETGNTCLPQDEQGQPISRIVTQRNARIRRIIDKVEPELRRTYETIYFIGEDGTDSIVYSGMVPELLQEELRKELGKGSYVSIVPIRSTDEIMIAVNGNDVRFHAYFREEVNFKTENPDFWRKFAKHAEINPHSEQAFQARMIVRRFWKMDPEFPDRVLQPDAELDFWCREGGIYDGSEVIRFAAEEYGEYGGRTLYHPSISGLYIRELCAEPGTYYGPWHVMRETKDNFYLVGCSDGDDFESALKAVEEVLKLPEFPEPLPELNKLPGADADKNEGFSGDIGTLDLDLFDDHKGKVFVHFCTRDDIWTETYRVEISKDGESLGTVAFGENQGDLIKLRDNREFFDSMLKSAAGQKEQRMRLQKKYPEIAEENEDSEDNDALMDEMEVLKLEEARWDEEG